MSASAKTSTNSNQSIENGLCKEHVHEYEANLLKPKYQLLPPLLTADTILSNLSHYVKSNHSNQNDKKVSSLIGATADELLQQIKKDKHQIQKDEHQLANPFVDIDASKINAKTNETLNYSCEVDSDIESATIDKVWENADQDSSDTESLDHEMHDPLRHAGVFTDKEMILALRNHAVRLQNFCIQQCRRLINTLRDKRSRYIMELKRENKIYGPLQRPRIMTLHEKKQFDQLRALARYQKIGTGPEALLLKKMLERRKAIRPGLLARSRNFNKCVFTEGGVRCCLKVIPSTKYCKKHILNDRHQVLFQECGIQKMDHICKEPTVPIPNVTCTFHFTLPKMTLALSGTP